MATAGTVTMTLTVPEAAQELADELREHADQERELALVEASLAGTLATAEHELKKLEAIMVLTGLDGKNAQEREANLLLTLENNQDYQRVYTDLRTHLEKRAAAQAWREWHLRQFMLKLELVRSMRAVT